MTEWVDVRNFDDLMSGYQKNDRSSEWMPGIADYFKKIIEQNDTIIQLLQRNNDLLDHLTWLNDE